MANKKREAREFCFQYFFHLQLPVFSELRRDLSLEQTSQLLTEDLNCFKETTNTLLDNTSEKFVKDLVALTLKNYETIQETLSDRLKNWKLNRLSKVDHTVLLLGISELNFYKKNSSAVVINESIEIAKKFGTENSSKFINGILDQVAHS